MKFLPLFVLSFFVAVMASADYKKLDSPFLGSTEKFKKAEWDKDAVVFRNPAKKTTEYKKVIFDPVLIYQSPNSKQRQLTAEEIVELGDEFKEMVEAKFKDAVEIVSAPGAGVLRVRFAMRGLTRGNYYLDAQGSQAIKPDSRLAAATFEVEGIDSLTGERVVALVQHFGSEVVEKSEKEGALQTVQNVFSNWVDVLKSVYLERKALPSTPAGK